MESTIKIQYPVRSGLKAGRGCTAHDSQCCMGILNDDGKAVTKICGTGVGTAQQECLSTMNAHPDWNILGIFACA